MWWEEWRGGGERGWEGGRVRGGRERRKEAKEDEECVWRTRREVGYVEYGPTLM